MGLASLASIQCCAPAPDKEAGVKKKTKHLPSEEEH